MESSASKKPVEGLDVKNCVQIVVAGGVLLILLVNLVFQGWFENGIYAARLLPGFETTVGRITHQSNGNRSQGWYEFHVDGQKYENRGVQGEEGDTIQVAYLKSNPKVNRPKDVIHYDFTLTAVLPLLSIAVIATIAVSFYKARTSKEANDEIASTEPEQSTNQNPKSADD